MFEMEERRKANYLQQELRDEVGQIWHFECAAANDEARDRVDNIDAYEGEYADDDDNYEIDCCGALLCCAEAEQKLWREDVVVVVGF